MIHLAVDLSFTHTGGRWRLPGGWAGRTFPDPAMFEEFAIIAERGKLDLLFFGDGTGIPDVWDDGIDGAVRWGIGWPRQDMSPYIAHLARSTRHLGFGLTYSSTFQHPYYVARLLNSLDHITGGRIAFNVVASSRVGDAANFGYDTLMPHDERYERMDEFVDVCLDLWRSVESDAIVEDRATGHYADPARVHRVDHRGPHFTVRGPLISAPSPHVRPLLVQAGASPRGVASAARFADAVFTQGGPLAMQQRHRAALDAELARQGRSAVPALRSQEVLIADTEEEATAARAQLLDIWPAEAVAVQLSNAAGFDLSTLPSEFALGEIGDRIARISGSQSGFFAKLIAARGADAVMTRDELFEEGRLAVSGYQHVLAGTAAQIADHLEDIHERTGGGGGFMLSSPGAMPRALAAIVDLLVPELQARGVFRRDYEGDTLSENLLGRTMAEIDHDRRSERSLEQIGAA